jgi:geranylgeranyl pyrophosphate synthase
MIGKKTAEVFGAAAELGALAGGGTPAQVSALGRYGRRLGVAFQIRDDVLDVTGDPRKFGKKTGVDIRNGKKTFLYVKSMARATPAERRALAGRGAGPNGSRIAAVTRIYERLGAVADAERKIGRLTADALGALDRLPPSRARAALRMLAGTLTRRTV